MATNSEIEWTDATWNPVSGCTHASAGCDHCYAVTMTHRLEMMGQTAKYGGLTVLNQKGDRHFNGVVRCHEDALSIPLKRKKPTTYFVNSMSDLFHKGVPFEFIDKVFAVMALCPQHTFQILTKRPERMAEYTYQYANPARWNHVAYLMGKTGKSVNDLGWENPLPNVWLGTSCENQQTADERIPHLLKCPAAVRFLSCEPLLVDIDLAEWLWTHVCTQCERQSTGGGSGESRCSNCKCKSVIPRYDRMGEGKDDIGIIDAESRMRRNINTPFDWVIVGGESGKGARPCHVEWIRSIVEQCREAGVACFVKQLGKIPAIEPSGMDAWPDYPHYSHATLPDGTIKIILNDNKGGDPDEWPEDLRVREMPKAMVIA